MFFYSVFRFFLVVQIALVVVQIVQKLSIMFKISLKSPQNMKVFPIFAANNNNID